MASLSSHKDLSRKRWFWIATALAFAAPASAQSGAELAARRDLLDQAERARVANDHATALTLAERAGAIQMSPSLRLFLATEQRELGRVADAVGNAEACVREANRDATLRNRAVIEQQCQTILDTLRAEVGRVVMQVPNVPAGMVMQVGGVTVPNTMVGLPYMVRPGSIAINISAPNFRTFVRTVEVARGASVDVTVALEPVATYTGPIPQPDPDDPNGRVRPPVVTPPPPPSSGPGIAPWIVVGIGGAALITGGILLGLNASAVGALNAECPDLGNGTRGCPNIDSATLDSRISSANGLATGGVIAASVGGAAAVGGVLWFVLAPRRRAEGSAAATSARVHVAPLVASHVSGVMVGGAW